MTAIAILGVVVTAQPTRTSSSDRLVRLESDLRYQLELGSRVDPAAFAQRTKSLDAALDAWRKSPQSTQDFEVMRGWLREALVKSLPGEEGEWPEGPKFSLAAEVRVVRKEVVDEDERSQASGDRGQGNATVAEEVKPVAEAGVAQPQVAKTQSKAAPKTVAAKPITARPAVAPPVVTKQNPQRAPNVDVAKRAAPTVAEAAGVYKGVKAELVGAKPPLGRELGAERQAADSRAVKVEAAKPAPVAVNLAELNARVGGYHEGLREIEAAVVAGREEMTVGQVAMLVGQLEQLAGHCQFVQLYYDSLTRDERTSVTEPRSMAETVKLVERERARVETAEDEDFLASNEVVEEGELAMRLKALAEVAERGGKRCCD
ncbi:MAG: hypothetical protein H0T51_11855 [Pirellulales bacterium]|nr:hypothetical protein [Pirellulales bacterium]